jgi:cellulose synthase/poly-beta-1,6-N-acetylglucosamine synthase-like glycosyltransferase
MIYFLLLISLLFIFSSLTVAYHVYKIFSQTAKETDSFADKNFSIIIAAKNEESNIPALIGSLKNLRYREEKTEIIITDDNSSDNTFNSASEIAALTYNVRVFKAENKKLQGKKGVLDLGISKSSGEYILITDADCIPEPDWINGYCSRFSQGYDLLFGVAPFVPGGNIINKISCFENMRSSLITFAAASLGVPYSASARNLGFRKSSFYSLNGYYNTRETLSGDDDLLIREALRNKLKIGTVTSEGSKVFSCTKNSFKDYFRQKSRHTKTSFYYMPLTQVLLSFWHSINIFFLLSPFLLLINPLFISLFLIKICFDLLLVLKFQKRFG